MADELVVGIDFGTLSGRVVVVRVSDGAELGTAVHEYAHAVMEDSLTAGDGRRLVGDEWQCWGACGGLLPCSMRPKGRGTAQERQRQTHAARAARGA